MGQRISKASGNPQATEIIKGGLLKKEKRYVTKQVRSRVIYTRTDWLIFWPEQKRLCEYEEPGCSRKRKQVRSHVLYIHELTDIYIDLFMYMWTGASATKRGIGKIVVGEHEDLALFFLWRQKIISNETMKTINNTSSRQTLNYKSD